VAEQATIGGRNGSARCAARRTRVPAKNEWMLSPHPPPPHTPPPPLDMETRDLLTDTETPRTTKSNLARTEFSRDRSPLRNKVTYGPLSGACRQALLNGMWSCAFWRG